MANIIVINTDSDASRIRDAFLFCASDVTQE